MRLFDHDDVALRPSEIRRRGRLNREASSKALQRLVDRGQLFHIGHAQYSRCATTQPLSSMKADRLAALERRVDELERKTGTLCSTWSLR